MKKLLLVLMVVAMASFLFVGCIPSPAPDPDPDPDPTPTPTAITATITVATETPADADGKVFVQGGSRKITVTFSEAVGIPVVKVGTVDVAMFSPEVPGKAWTGYGNFVGPCDAVIITVGGVCEEFCDYAKSVVVDSGLPYAELKATVAECECDTGFALTVTSDWTAALDCPPDDKGCCGDDCSKLASWNIKIYDEMPWKDCCAGDTCVDPIAEADGTACPVTITTECIDEVFTQDDGWVDFFSNHYWVIASLTDKVGNTISYYGEVYPDAVTEGVDKFVELFYDPTSLDCLCDAENPALADAIIGDCDGTPATECWVADLKPCPVVTVVPATPKVGELATITIDYDVLGLEAVKPTGAVSAYVGSSIKTLPLGIPEDSQELVLTDNEDWSYTATYTFGQAGTDYIYVVDGCTDCTPCKTGVTVVARVCPKIAIDDAVLFEGDWYIDAGEHDIIVTFASPLPIEQVRIFVVEDLSGDWENAIVPEDAVELIISTVNNLVYTATSSFTGACADRYVIVQYGESCCPVICTAKFIVDSEAPVVTLAAVLFDCSDCDSAEEVWISSDTCAYSTDDCPGTPPTCKDACTEFDWTLTVYDGQPFDVSDCAGDDCVPSTCVNEIASDTGTGCPVDLDVFGCLVYGDDVDAVVGTYYVVFEAVDIVGNTLDLYGILTVSTTEDITITYSPSSFSTSCQIY